MTYTIRFSWHGAYVAEKHGDYMDAHNGALAVCETFPDYDAAMYGVLMVATRHTPVTCDADHVEWSIVDMPEDDPRYGIAVAQGVLPRAGTLFFTDNDGGVGA